MNVTINRVFSKLRFIVPSGQKQSNVLDVTAFAYGRVEVMGFVNENGEVTGAFPTNDTIQFKGGLSSSYLEAVDDESGTPIAARSFTSSRRSFQMKPDEFTPKFLRVDTGAANSNGDILIEVQAYA